jgi:SAM-dependent methyltransferase
MFEAAQWYRRVRSVHQRTRNRPGQRVPVTARSWRYYDSVLFPDVKIARAIRGRTLLDVGSGANHLYPKSLLHRVGKRGLGLDLSPFPNSPQYRRATLEATGLPSRSRDLILSNNVLYFWIDTRKAVRRCLCEIHRLLRPNGEARIFPVFYGNYHLNDPKLFAWIHRHFWVRVIQPRTYPAEAPLIHFGGEMLRTDASVGTGEVHKHQQLQSHTLILRKVT